MPAHLKVEYEAPMTALHPRSIEAFCLRQGISRATYYNLVKAGKAPNVLRIGARVTIPEHAEIEWVYRNTAPAHAA